MEAGPDAGEKRSMASVNKAIILGNLGKDPELRHTQGGKAVCTLRVATNEVWNDQAGERKERTEWHTIVVWGRQAENCNQYLKKGRSVYVEGRLSTRKWQDKEGHDRYSTEVVADRVQFVGGGKGEGAGAGASGGGGGGFDDAHLEPPPSGSGDDDIPF
jgi:single-strand DNA-binding protein